MLPFFHEYHNALHVEGCMLQCLESSSCAGSWAAGAWLWGQGQLTRRSHPHSAHGMCVASPAAAAAAACQHCQPPDSGYQHGCCTASAARLAPCVCADGRALWHGVLGSVCRWRHPVVLQVFLAGRGARVLSSATFLEGHGRSALGLHCALCGSTARCASRAANPAP